MYNDVVLNGELQPVFSGNPDAVLSWIKSSRFERARYCVYIERLASIISVVDYLKMAPYENRPTE